MSFTKKDLINLVESMTPEERKTFFSFAPTELKDKKKTPKTRKPRTSKSKTTGQSFDPSICWARCYAVQDEHVEKFGKDGEKLEKHNHIGLIDFQCTGKIIGNTHYCYKHGGHPEKPTCQRDTSYIGDDQVLFLGDFGKLDHDGNPVNIPRPQNPIRVSKKGNQHKFTFLDEMGDDLDKYIVQNKSKGKSKANSADKDITFDDIDWEDNIKSDEIYKFNVKTLKLYLEKFGLPVKGNKKDKIEAIIDHFEENEGDLDGDQSDGESTHKGDSEEEEVVDHEEQIDSHGVPHPKKQEPDEDEEDDEEDDEDSEEEEQEEEQEVLDKKDEDEDDDEDDDEEDDEEDDEGDDEEDDEVVVPDSIFIAKVKYIVQEGFAYDIATNTKMGPINSSTPSDTDTSKWKKSERKLHKKNIENLQKSL